MINRSVKEWDYLAIDEAGAGAFTRNMADRVLEVAASVGLGGQEGEQILINHPRKLRAQQIVGIVAADGVTVEILPKIDGGGSDADIRRRLIHMLAVVLDLEIADGTVTNVDWQNDNILEILIRLFCDHLFAVVHRGLPRRYVSYDEDLTKLRGRLDVNRQFTVLAASPQMLACRFDELSSDIALNQIMKAAVARLSAVSQSAINQRRLTELAFAFAGITSVPVAMLPWHDVTIDRTNRSWAQLFEFAKLLLGNRFQTTSGGQASGFSLLFEMNTLFEEFVGRMIQRTLVGSGYAVRLQGPQNHALVDFDGGHLRFATRPDIVISLNGQPQLIIDTKWKRLKGMMDDRKHGVAQTDIYQMMAYAHVYKCKRLMLLYPHHAALSDEAGLISAHQINGTADSRIGVATLSLTEPRKVTKALKALILNGQLNFGLPAMRASGESDAVNMPREKSVRP